MFPLELLIPFVVAETTTSLETEIPEYVPETKKTNIVFHSHSRIIRLSRFSLYFRWLERFVA